jgi:hypothetical protein
MISIERIPIRIGNRKVSLIAYITGVPRALMLWYSFSLIVLSCIFFRSDTIETAFMIIKRIFTFIPSDNFSLIIGWKVMVVPLLILIEAITMTKTHPFINLDKYISKPVRWIVYYSIILILIRYAGPKEQFIYFQF